jgi:hypothetical protein
MDCLIASIVYVFVLLEYMEHNCRPNHSTLWEIRVDIAIQ